MDNLNTGAAGKLIRLTAIALALAASGSGMAKAQSPSQQSRGAMIAPGASASNSGPEYETKSSRQPDLGLYYEPHSGRRSRPGPVASTAAPPQPLERDNRLQAHTAGGTVRYRAAVDVSTGRVVRQDPKITLASAQAGFSSRSSNEANASEAVSDFSKRADTLQTPTPGTAAPGRTFVEPSRGGISKRVLLILGVGAAVAGATILSIQTGSGAATAPSSPTVVVPTTPTTISIGGVSIGGPQ